MNTTILHGECTSLLDAAMLTQAGVAAHFDLTFLDPPFNQNKDYEQHDDDLPPCEYWLWMEDICRKIYDLTTQGGALYFMHREKNAEFVLRALREANWTLQNLIVWKKKTSAVPGSYRFGKSFQIIAFATKGSRPRIFNRLRINPPLLANQKQERPDGMYVTDIWDDIRELTSGYFAGDEALRDADGSRVHKQQSPRELLLRILLSSTKPGDTVLDPFAGTGTTLVVAEQLSRAGVGIELSEKNVAVIKARTEMIRTADDIHKLLDNYKHTANLDSICGVACGAMSNGLARVKTAQSSMFNSTVSE